jgi:hypothetical protein
MTSQHGVAALVLALSLPAASPAWSAQVDVGVSVQISQPGIYGRIDIGRYPQPQVIATRPVFITQPQPVYMWVPPGHRKHWRQHCGAYGACATPVVFVRDDGYDRNARPYGERKNRGKGKGYGKPHGKGHDKGHAKEGRGRD